MGLFAGNKFATEDGFYITYGNGGIIRFDLHMSEEHAMESVVAEHPIEGGAGIALHIHNKLREGSFEGLISNWSYAFRNTLLGTGGQPTNRAKDTYDDLLKLYEKKTLVTLVLGLQAYPDCAIVRIGATRNGSSGDAQKFTVAFKQVKKVTLKTTKLAIAASKMGTSETGTIPMADVGSSSGTVVE